MSQETTEKRVDIGGQAVMEGVMMKAPRAIAIAVRKEDGEIVVESDPYHPLSEKHRWMGLPLIRGMVNMVNMLSMGMKTLDKSTKMLGIMEEEPSKFEKWLAEKLGVGLEKVIMPVAMVMAVALSLFLFVMIPSAAGTLFASFIGSKLVVNLLTGVVRIAILIIYIGSMSFIPDIKRVFQYHGAEHKTVYCYEAKLPLTPENARQFSRLHPRCGTAFLLLVMVISILVASIADEVLGLFGIQMISFWVRMLRSLIIIPLVTGLSYELLRALAHNDNWLVRLLRWPGLKLQLLTTKEPDDRMLEVAIASMKAALKTSAEEEARIAGVPQRQEEPAVPVEPQA